MNKSSKLPESVLFVCTLNSIRSPMAEGLMKKRFGTEVYAQSCGIETGELNQIMVATMGEDGIDMSGHTAKTLEQISDTSFDVLIAFTDDAAAAARSVFDDSDTLIEVWPTPDPTAGAQDVRAMMDNFRAIRENLDMRLERRFTSS